MMGLMELCARNLSEAVRETLNAQVAARQTAEASRTVEGHPAVPESVVKKINEARLLLEIAHEELTERSMHAVLDRSSLVQGKSSREKAR